MPDSDAKPVIPDTLLESEQPRVLSDVIARLATDVQLSPTRRRDLICSIRWLVRALGRPADKIDARLAALKQPLSMLEPASLGVVPKTLQNHKANLIAALHHVGAAGPGARAGTFGPEWIRLRQKLTDIALRHGLSRFFRFCSRRRIRPPEVGDAVMDEYEGWLRDDTLHPRPGELRARTCRLWNRAAAAIPGWPARFVSVPDRRKPRTKLLLTEMNEDFRRDVEAHLRWLTGFDLFATHRPPKPLKRRTIALRREHILVAATALIRSGRPPGTICSLADLTRPEAMMALLDVLHQRTGRTSVTVTMHQVAKALISIGHNWLRLDSQRMNELKKLKAALGSQPRGLTEKNEAMLGRLADPEILARLLALPEVLQALAEARATSARAPVMVQLALAVEILLKAPMRMGNLINLRLDEHVHRRPGLVHLVVLGDSVKNGERLSYQLRGSSADLFERFVDDWRPRLPGSETPYLFCSINGRKSQGRLSEQIATAIAQHVGLKMSPHQFRHAAAAIALEANPGALSQVQALLGHRSPHTAMIYYGGNNPLRAGRQYDELIEEKRAKAKPPRRSRPSTTSRNSQ